MESNVDKNGQVLDPTKVRHVTIKGGKIEALSGYIDPASHLNLDYRDHKVTVCVIAEKFSVGATIRFADQGLSFATVNRSSYSQYGPIDYTQRLTDMVAAVKKEERTATGLKSVGKSKPAG